MQKLIKTAAQLEKPMDKPAVTVGLDLGDRFSQYCMLNQEGEVVESGRIPTAEAALRRHFEGEGAMRVALECGTHSAWISRLLEQLGHQVVVANTRKIRAITPARARTTATMRRSWRGSRRTIRVCSRPFATAAPSASATWTWSTRARPWCARRR